MKAVPRTAPTMIPIIFPEELLSGDGDPDEDDEADREEDVARGGRRRDDEAIADEELVVVIEDLVAENAVAVLAASDGLADTVSPFSKKTPFLWSQHGCPMVPLPQQ